MKVQEVQVAGNIRYILIDSNGGPVVTVAKYLKYLDLIGKSTNTLKAYCYHLKLYYQFLEEIDIKTKNYVQE